MEIEIQLTGAPIPAPQSPPSTPHGAWVEFRGVVRGEEAGRTIAAIEYEAYTPMAELEMRRILLALAERLPCLATRVIHRIGVVPVGEAAIYVGVAARHRAEAFALLAEFMDRLKADVPIWKQRALTAAEMAGSHGPQPRPAEAGRLLGSAGGAARSAAEVVALLGELCTPLETERVPLADAAGRVLREAVCAPEDQPAFDRSSVDGFAVRCDDQAASFRVVEEIRAGDWKPRRLEPGEAVRIATGGALPGDGLQVIMKEDTRLEREILTVLRREPDRNVRFRGEDARAGETLIESGTILSPGTLALLASVGAALPWVTRLPRVLHVATGNEIVPPEQTPASGQIRDSNSTLVRAFLARWSIVPEQHRVGEDADAIKSEIRTQKSESTPPHLLLVSGGASVGEHDFTRRLLEELGFTILVSKTTARPGKPLIVARRDGTLAFGLPGNPLAHFVCLNLYVRAALEGWSGQATRSGFRQGVLAADLAGGGHARETFWPARWQWGTGAAWVTPLRWSSSGDLTALAAANALIRVAAGEEKLNRRSRVEFLAV